MSLPMYWRLFARGLAACDAELCLGFRRHFAMNARTGETSRKTSQGVRMLDQTASLKDWLGRKRSEDDELSVGSVRRLAAMLDQDPTAYKRGVALPESWYALL